MTIDVVSDVTKTDSSHPDQHLFALAGGNMLAGMLGTMGGGSAIGVSMLNCTNGASGRYRISAIVVALLTFLYILFASTAIEVCRNRLVLYVSRHVLANPNNCSRGRHGAHLLQHI